MTDTPTGSANEAAPDAPDFPMPRAAGLPVRPATAVPIDELPFKHDALAYGLYELPVTW
jgi:hypothetical protein